MTGPRNPTPELAAHDAADATHDAAAEARWSEHRLDQMIGRLLQGGVALAALVVLVGAAVLIARHGDTVSGLAVFHGQPAYLRSLTAIVRSAFHGDGHALTQLGIVLLIATPVARVALTVLAFAVRRDGLYVLVTTVVLALLLVSFLGAV
ncbi:MAG TPA: DUF1634 domain-containing protein [Gemmatimonadaceae bacterium]|nr:DUF1634 domain-containing protein [Gemmatimonadaceae bacterium]